MPISVRSISILITLLLSSGLQAEAYKWVDENGVTVYSQTPPPSNVETQRMKPPPQPKETGGQGSRENLEQQYQAMQEREDERKKQAEESKKAEDLQEQRDQNCQAAQHNLKILEGPPRSLVQTPDGEYHRVTQEEREKQKSEAQKMVDQYCD